jgi:hypothetical protein
MIISSSNCFSIEVFDDDLGKDKSLGKVELDINLLKAVKNQWFPLQEYMLITLTLNRNLVVWADFFSGRMYISRFFLRVSFWVLS